jgi:hypothetical protein
MKPSDFSEKGTPWVPFFFSYHTKYFQETRFGIATGIGMDYNRGKAFTAVE